jgi:hypothetical protein
MRQSARAAEIKLKSASEISRVIVHSDFLSHAIRIACCNAATDMNAAVLYLALCWSGRDAGQHEIVVHHLMLSARECSGDIKLHRYHSPQDERPAPVPMQQIDVTPHE